MLFFFFLTYFLLSSCFSIFLKILLDRAKMYGALESQLALHFPQSLTEAKQEKTVPKKTPQIQISLKSSLIKIYC